MSRKSECAWCVCAHTHRQQCEALLLLLGATNALTTPMRLTVCIHEQDDHLPPVEEPNPLEAEDLLLEMQDLLLCAEGRLLPEGKDHLLPEQGLFLLCPFVVLFSCHYH